MSCPLFRLQVWKCGVADTISTQLMLRWLCAVLVFSNAAPVTRGASGAAKDKPDNCGGVHRPGDILTCYVTFEGNPKLTGLEVVFNLPREDKPRQHGSFISFVLRDTRKVGPHSYAASGVVPDCVPGTYILAG